MFRAIVLVVAIAVFAKPVYELAMDFMSHEETVAIQSVVQPQVENTEQVQQPASSAPTQQEVEIASEIDSIEKLTDAFYAYFSQYTTEFTIDYKGSTADIEYMLDKAINDALARDSYVAGHLSARQVNYEYTKFAATIHVQQTYLTDLQQEQVVNTKVSQLVASVNPAQMTDFEKVKFVNDYIVKNTQYSEDTVTSPHSAYTLVKEGKAVCQGYALFATKLLKALGVEAQYVTGEVYTGRHAWNLVKVDDEWYHLDTTWNDPVPDRGLGVSYSYFLMSDEQMRIDHTWQVANYPAAVSERFHFIQNAQDGYQHGDYLFYSNTKDNNTLYRVNLKTGESIQISTKRGLYIVGDGDWLYFSNYSNGAYLTKIRIDGTDEQILLREKVSNLFIDDGFINFTAEGQQKKIQLQ